MSSEAEVVSSVPESDIAEAEIAGTSNAQEPSDKNNAEFSAPMPLTIPLDDMDYWVPHQGVAQLLGAVLNVEPEALEATVPIERSHAYALADGVPSWIGLEYMAQAIAAFSTGRRLSEASAKDVRPKGGMLLGCRHYECSHPFFPLDAVIKVRVEQEFIDESGLGAFQCSPEGEGITARGRLTVYEISEAQWKAGFNRMATTQVESTTG